MSCEVLLEQWSGGVVAVQCHAGLRITVMSAELCFCDHTVTDHMSGDTHYCRSRRVEFDS